MIKTVVILGGGSAGLITALTLKRRLPQLLVRVVRSPEIGIIGVGEGTTANFRKHFFDYLGLHPRQFYAEAEPTWKLGLRFLWGPRADFFYTFSPEHDHRFPELARNTGFYQDAQTRWIGRTSPCMAHEKAFPRRADGKPDLGKLTRFSHRKCEAGALVGKRFAHARGRDHRWHDARGRASRQRARRAAPRER